MSTSPHRRRVGCDVAGLVHPDLHTVEALARLQLGLRRVGLQMELRHAGAELRGLIDLVGLAEALPLRAEPWGEAEQQEQAGGVQEEGDPAQPVAGDIQDLDRPRLEDPAGSGLVLAEGRLTVRLDGNEA